MRDINIAKTQSYVCLDYKMCAFSRAKTHLHVYHQDSRGMCDINRAQIQSYVCLDSIRCADSRRAKTLLDMWPQDSRGMCDINRPRLIGNVWLQQSQDSFDDDDWCCYFQKESSTRILGSIYMCDNYRAKTHIRCVMSTEPRLNAMCDIIV